MSEPLKALVVGLGSIGRRHAGNWVAGGYGPLAICRQRKLPHAAPMPHTASMPHVEPIQLEVATYTNLTEALEVERPEVVFVTNPTYLHVETACAALAAGAHVFVEKPLGCSLEGVQALLDVAQRQQRLVMVGYNLRFHPGLRRLKALLDEDTIGKVVSARAEAGEYLPDWHPWEDYRQGYSARADQGGGPVLTFSHELDALCWLLGRPLRVTAMAAHLSGLELSTEDVAEILLDFEAGAIGSVHVDYVRRPPRRAIELVGEAGVLRWKYERNVIEVYTAETGQWRREEGDRAFERSQMYVDELRHVVECVRGRSPDRQLLPTARGDGVRPVQQRLVDGIQGAAVLAVALAALRSAAEGRTIDLERGCDGETRAWLRQLGSRR